MPIVKINTSFKRCAMKFSQRASTLVEVGNRILQGADAGLEIKDFLHQYAEAGGAAMLAEAPPALAGHVDNGDRLDAYLQALAVHLSARLDLDPPSWTQPPVTLPQPWFASPGTAIRNCLLLSSPAPFRARNLFVDEDSLQVV